MADYNGRFEIVVTQILLGISLTAALPFCTKPAKDSLSELFDYDDS
jgi:hypothetical protein